jgi:phage terminase large subunit-like protein
VTPYSLADFTRFCRQLRTEAGKTLVLQAFQRRLLAPYFRGTRETVIVLPTGNGKTTLLAALAVYHMLRVPNAQVLIVASAADQAATLFKQCRILIQDSPLEVLLDVKNGIRAIYHKGEGPNRRRAGEIRVIASEVGKQEGAIPTLVLVDELHAHHDLAMYEMLRDKLWKRASERGCGRMIAISTAGFTFNSPLYKLRETVIELPTYKRRGPMCSATGPGFSWHEYALDPDQDRDDLSLVVKVNPAPWVTRKALQARKSSPTMSPGEWARSACNVWTAGAEQPIKPEEWDRLRVDIGAIEDGEQVILVPSVGHNAAIGIAAERSDGRVAVRAEILPAEETGSTLIRTEDRILELCKRYDVLGVHHPLGAFIRSADLLSGEGVPMVEAPHSVTRLSAASGTFNRMLRSGLLMHDGDPELRAHVLSATLKTNEAGERYEISDRARALIALVMAVHAATVFEPEPYIGLPSEGIG